MMKETKGIILEINNDKGIILTSSGEFKEIPVSNSQFDIGMEITYDERKKGSTAKYLFSVAAAAVLVLIFFTTLNFLQPQNVVAYVTLDINPSLEIALNKENKVISVNPLNDDGKNLIQNLNLVDKGINETIEIITNEAISQEYISSANEENAVVITVISPKGKKSNYDNIVKSEEIADKVKEVTAKQGIVVEAEGLELKHEIRIAANEMELSPAKYLLLLEAWEQGIDIDLEEIKTQPIISTIKKAGGNSGKIIAQAKNEEAFAKKAEKYAEKLKERSKNQEQIYHTSEGQGENKVKEKGTRTKEYGKSADLKETEKIKLDDVKNNESEKKSEGQKKLSEEIAKIWDKEKNQNAKVSNDSDKSETKDEAKDKKEKENLNKDKEKKNESSDKESKDK